MKKSSNGHDPQPEHIKQGWLDLSAAIMAALARNGCRGYAGVTIRLVAHDLDVVLWREPEIALISPVTLVAGGITTETAMALSAVLEET